MNAIDYIDSLEGKDIYFEIDKLIEEKEKGNKEVDLKLGLIYRDIKSNYDKAFDFLLEAANNGDEDAMFELSEMHSNSSYGRKDPFAFIDWRIKSKRIDEYDIGLIVNKLDYIKKQINKRDVNAFKSFFEKIHTWRDEAKDFSDRLYARLIGWEEDYLREEVEFLLYQADSVKKFSEVGMIINNYSNKETCLLFVDDFYERYGKYEIDNCKNISDNQTIANIMNCFNKISNDYKRNNVLDYLYFVLAESYFFEINGAKKSEYNGKTIITKIKKQGIIGSFLIRNKVNIDTIERWSSEDFCNLFNAIAKAHKDGVEPYIVIDKNLSSQITSYVESIKRKESNRYDLRSNDCFFNNIYQTQRYESYETDNYTFMCGDGYVSINPNENNIYYFKLYYPTKSDDYHTDKRKRLRTNTILDIKNGVYLINSYKKQYVINYPFRISNFLRQLNGDWIICFAPRHSSIDYINNVSLLMDECNIPREKIVAKDLIVRTVTIPEKHSSSHNTSYKSDLETIGINKKYDVKGKRILVIDDITTSGATMIACRCLLLNHDAKEVVCLSLSKTCKYGEVDFDND